MKFWSIRNFPPSVILRWVLVTAASLFSLLILLKAVFDLDTNWDTLWYHLPFAARFWGIVPESSLQLSPLLETRYVSFPILAEYLEGLAWYVTERPESANLVAFFSLAAYLLFLTGYFRVPLYLAALALLAVPVVHIHASRSLVDLFGNLAVSTQLMVVFTTYIGRRAPTLMDLSLATIAATVAINTKLQLVPIASLGLALLILKIVFPSFLSPGAVVVNRGKSLALLALVLPLVFFTPLKNTWLYGNPFFPLNINVSGITLPGTEPMRDLSPLPLLKMPRSQRWLYSVLELSPGRFVQPIWTVDQYTKRNHPGFSMGGTFGAYMLFNLLFLGFMAWRIRSPEVGIGLTLFVLVSLVTSLFPASHIVRYYMYWPVFLISINLALLQTAWYDKFTNRFISNDTFGAVALLAMLVIVVRTNGIYTFPQFASIDDNINKVVDKSLVDRLAPGEKLCFVGELYEPEYFLYALKLREGSGHVIRTVYEKSECGAYRVVEKPAP